MPYQLPLRCARAVPRGRGPLASNVSYLTEAGPTRGAVKLWRRGVCRVLSRESRRSQTDTRGCRAQSWCIDCSCRPRRLPACSHGPRDECRIEILQAAMDRSPLSGGSTCKTSRSTSLSRTIVDFPDRGPLPRRVVPAYRCFSLLCRPVLHRFSCHAFFSLENRSICRYFDGRSAGTG
jgi:hypothetical protein